MLLRWNDLGYGFAPAATYRGPFEHVDQLRVRVSDIGDELRLHAELPGYRQQDLQVSFEENTLVIRGERAAEVPEGYAVQRQERGGARFTRSFALTARIDADKIVASLKDGVLELRLPKAAETRARTIAVNAS